MEADAPAQAFAALIVCNEFTLAAAETWVADAFSAACRRGTDAVRLFPAINSKISALEIS